MNHSARPAALLVLLISLGCNAEPPAPTTEPAAPKPQALPTIKIDLNGKPVTLQVADDDAEREKGLMFTRAMPVDAGMIFVFPVERPLAFWMQNTPIDLDIVYANAAGTVVAVKTMRAYDETTVPSDEPAAYAIELNSGVAGKLGVKVGQHLTLPAELAKNAR